MGGLGLWEAEAALVWALQGLRLRIEDVGVGSGFGLGLGSRFQVIHNWPCELRGKVKDLDVLTNVRYPVLQATISGVHAKSGRPKPRPTCVDMFRTYLAGDQTYGSVCGMGLLHPHKV